MTITVSIPNNELLSMQEDIDERINELEIEYGGTWRISGNSFVGELNLKDFLLNNGLTLVV